MHCLHCGRQLRNSNSTYCNNTCQREYEHNAYITSWLKGDLSGNRLGAAVSNHVRRWLKDTRGEHCEQCGWNAINPVTQKSPLDVDHINGDSTNSSPNNIRLLCPNCHSLTPTYKNLNKGKGRSNRK